MRHLHQGTKLQRTGNERKALLKQLAKSLILHNHIITTEAKAKAARHLVERLITKAKAPDRLASRRYALRFVTAEAARKLFDVLGPKYQTRPGGYTRIIKLNRRIGDNARRVKMELV